MDYKQITELIKMINDSKLTSFEMENEDVRIKMNKGEISSKVVTNEEEVKVPKKNINSNEDISKAEIQAEVEGKVEEKEDKDISLILSPIVGTYYDSPSPDEEGFVKIGNKVKKGDVVCILEAMKLMNEIQAEEDCEIVEILVENEEMVEYGQPLFKVRNFK